MNAVLLTHESPFQIYCANQLFRAGVLEAIVVEDGFSIRRERLNLRDIFSSLRAGLHNVYTDSVRGWWRAWWQLHNLVHHHLYYGHRTLHHQRLLRDCEVFNPELSVTRVTDINAAETSAFLHQQKAELVFVHGTRLIRRSVLEAVHAPFVNLHWGWSPQYRAEGIVSALALEGPHALGVTVHLLDEGIDRGPILYQARLTIDALDNFYSLAVKLTVLGTELFLKVAEDYARHGFLRGIPQVTHKSQLFSGKYLRDHPELFRLAWRNLERAQQTLSWSVDEGLKHLTERIASFEAVTETPTIGADE